MAPAATGVSQHRHVVKWRFVASAQQVPLEYRGKSLADLFTGIERHKCHEWQAHNHYLRTAVMASQGESAAVVCCCHMAPFHPLFHAPLRSASGGARSLNPLVGRGPRDQSSGQKPRARLPEVLACRAALRFKRANGREAGRAGLPRLLLNRGLNPFLGGVLDECGSEHSKSSRGHFFLKNDPRSLFGFHFPSTLYRCKSTVTELCPSY